MIDSSIILEIQKKKKKQPEKNNRTVLTIENPSN